MYAKSQDYISENILQKHYLKSSYADLYRSLCREVKKVKKLNPNKYYICCAQKLTPNNITDIYNLFDEYMTDSNNVIDLSVIDTFLNEPENYDILRKHFKLWLESTEILNQVNNRNICRNQVYSEACKDKGIDVKDRAERKQIHKESGHNPSEYFIQCKKVF